MVEFDYSTDEPITVGENVIKSLQSQCEEVINLEIKMAKLEKEMSDLQKKHRDLTEFKIPEAVAEAGLGMKFSFPSGMEVVIDERLRGSMKNGNEDEGVTWLEDNGGGDIIKRQFVIDFNKAEEAWAKKFEADLKKRKVQLRCVRKRTVHPATLIKFLGEKMQEGIVVPMKTFGVYNQKFTNVKPAPVKE